MDKKDLAESIKNRIIIIGTSIKHIDSIAKYMHQITDPGISRQFQEAFAILYVSLQNYVYIELFKLFDKSGNDTKEHNVYALINLMKKDDKSKYHKMLSPYNKDIEAICKRRNSIFAHELGKNGQDVFSSNPISHDIVDLLKCITNICCIVNDALSPNISIGNAEEFDLWLQMTFDIFQKYNNINEKIMKTKFVTPQIFEANIDIFIDELDQSLINQFKEHEDSVTSQNVNKENNNYGNENS